MPEPIHRRYLRSAGWAVVGGLAGYLGSFVATAVLARRLEPEAFGTYKNLSSLVGLTALIGGFEVRHALRQAIPLRRGEGPEAVGFLLGTSALIVALFTSLLAVGLAAGSQWMATALYGNESIGGLIVVASMAMVFSVLAGWLEGLLQGLEAFRGVAVWRSGALFVSLSLQLVFAYRWGVNGALAGLVVMHGLAAAALGVVARREIRLLSGVRFGVVAQEVRRVLSFSAGMLLTAVFYPLGEWAIGVFLGRARGYGETGLFLAALALVRIVNSLAQPVCVPLVPILADTLRQPSQRNGVHRLIARFLKVYVSATILACVLLAGNATLVMTIVFGRAFAGAGLLLAVLAPSVVFFAATDALSRVVVAEARTWLLWGWNLSWFCFLGLAAAVLGATFGVLGYAMAFGLAEAFRAGLGWVIASRRYRLQGREMRSLAAIGVLSCGAAIACSRLPPLLGLAASLGVTVLAAWLLWRYVVEEGDKEAISQALSRHYAQVFGQV